ncbi:MAG: MFS transporter [Candidatus Magasanikbacteria bacterium]|nr:MFS transporter [Candidatus Magasanikbacteria bacterium]
MRKTLFIALFIGFVNILSFTIIIPIIYVYAREYGLNNFQTSLLFGLFPLAQFFATPVIGKLADIFGRKKLLVISLFGTGVASLMTAFAPTVLFLFLARFLDGVTGGNNSVAQAVISDIVEPKNRAKIFGIFGAMFGLGFIVGPILSLVFVKYSLNMPYIASALFAFTAMIITLFFLPETLKKIDEKTSVNCKKLFNKEIFTAYKIPKLAPLFIISLASGLTFTMFTFTFQPYILNGLGGTVQDITYLLILFGMVSMLVQIFAIGPISKKFKLIYIISVALFLRGITFILLPIIPIFWYFVVVSVALSLVNPLVKPIITTLITNISDSKRIGEMLGINTSYLSLSNAIGPVIGGVLLGINLRAPFIIAGIFIIFIAYFAFRYRFHYISIDKS